MIIPLLQIRIGFEAGAGIGFFATIEPDWSQLKFNLIQLCFWIKYYIF